MPRRDRVSSLSLPSMSRLTRRPNDRARAIPLLMGLWISLTLLLPTAPASSQEAPSDPGIVAQAPAQPETIRTEDVAPRAGEIQQLLQSLRTQAEQDPGVAEIEEKLANTADSLAQESVKAAERLASDPSSAAEVERFWTELEGQVDSANQLLEVRLKSLASDLDRLDEAQKRWERTREAAREQMLPKAVRSQIDSVLADVATTRKAVKSRRDSVLTLQSTLAERSRTVAIVLAKADEAVALLKSGLFALDSPPIWELTEGASREGVWFRLKDSWSRQVDSARTFVWNRRTECALFVITFAALVFAVVLLGRQARSLGEDQAEFEPIAQILSRPVAAAALVSMLSLPVLVPTAPPLVILVIEFLILISALRLLGPLLSRDLRFALYLLTLWWLTDSLKVLLTPAPVVARSLLLVESAIAAGFLAWLLRPARLDQLSRTPTRWLRSLGIGMRLALALLVVALISNLAGNVTLASHLTEATLLSGYYGVVILGSSRVLVGLWFTLLRTAPARSLKMVRDHEGLLRRRGERLLRAGPALLWVWLTLVVLGVQDDFITIAEGILGATWPLGENQL